VLFSKEELAGKM